jgi:hypothetical protein
VAIEGELRSHEYQREVAVGTQRTSIPQRVWESVWIPCPSSTAPPSANRMTTVTRRCPAEGHLLTTIE